MGWDESDARISIGKGSTEHTFAIFLVYFIGLHFLALNEGWLVADLDAEGKK